MGRALYRRALAGNGVGYLYRRRLPARGGQAPVPPDAGRQGVEPLDVYSMGMLE
ncbi:MAG TPA: hypothetical protein VF099_03420 [Ktedonobacterales bacterium]